MGDNVLMTENIFDVLINGSLNIISTLVQVICFPINAVIVKFMPNLTDKIIEVSDVLSTIFNNMVWGLGFLPPVLVGTLLFIITVEISRISIFISTKAIIMIWHLVQNIKFW